MAKHGNNKSGKKGGKKGSNKQYTPNQQEYLRLSKNLARRIAKAEEKGYRFEGKIIPDEMPKRVTKSMLNEFRKYRGDALYLHATALDYDTGEIISGSEQRRNERREIARKSREKRKRKQNNVPQPTSKQEQYIPDGGEIVFDNVVDRFMARLAQPTDEYALTRRGRRARRWEDAIEKSEEAKWTLLRIVDSAIQRDGKSAVGWRLQANADEVSHLTSYVLYGSDGAKIASACSELATIINDGALSLEQLQDIGEQEEYNESHEYPT